MTLWSNQARSEPSLVPWSSNRHEITTSLESCSPGGAAHAQDEPHCHSAGARHSTPKTTLEIISGNQILQTPVRGQVSGGEMEEKEKQKSTGTMERDKLETQGQWGTARVE